jgi:drug/metabolite transporter (DMT)-like permease
MSVFALTLVLISALLHATWNLFAKRAKGGTAFVWLFSALACLIYLPMLVYFLWASKLQINAAAALLLAGTCLLHLAYYLLLDRGYRAGDMSLVYPLARGTGPLLALIGAVLLLGERPHVIAVVGAALVAAGIFVLTGSPLAAWKSDARGALIFGLLTGLTIAAYTLWDKQVVSSLSSALSGEAQVISLITPAIVLIWFSGFTQTLILAPYALSHRDEVRAAWKNSRREASGIALLDSLSYILFLVALVLAPVSYAAPARQMSILLGTVMGTRLLSEGDATRRLAGAGVMLVGLLTLALS